MLLLTLTLLLLPTTFCSALHKEPGFAEVLPSLTDQEMDWLELGELQMVLEKAGGPELRISGYITTRQSCDGEEGWGLAPRVHIIQRHKRGLRKSPE